MWCSNTDFHFSAGFVLSCSSVTNQNLISCFSSEKTIILDQASGLYLKITVPLLVTTKCSLKFILHLTTTDGLQIHVGLLTNCFNLSEMIGFSQLTHIQARSGLV